MILNGTLQEVVVTAVVIVPTFATVVVVVAIAAHNSIVSLQIMLICQICTLFMI